MNMTLEELQEENEKLNRKCVVLKEMYNTELKEKFELEERLKKITKESNYIYEKINEEFKKNNIDRDLRDYIENRLRNIYIECKSY